MQPNSLFKSYVLYIISYVICDTYLLQLICLFNPTTKYLVVNKMKYKQINLNIAPQTKLAAIGYFLIFASSLIVYSLVKDGAKNKFVLNIASLLISIPIALYGINCSVVGKCETYAWIYGYLLFSYGILAALMLIFSLIR